MKITIESVNSLKARITLETDDEVFTETWVRDAEGTLSCRTDGHNIPAQIADTGVYPEEFIDVSDGIIGLNISDFFHLIDIEGDYKYK